MRAASRGEIGIPHYIVNFERKFEEHVISDFVREYSAGGRRSRACTATAISSSRRWSSARRHSAREAVATGHYAQVDFDEASRRYRLKRGVDRQKDQSYFLFTLSQAQLARARFPVGALDKPAVREEARRLGLRVAEKKDSQEICFVAAGEHPSSSARRADMPAARSAIARGACSAATTACTASPSASARGSASPPACRCMSWHRRRQARRHRRPARGAGPARP
jgi:tRNA U34 2-thiouridine synthase MnmA/TrmU